VGEKEAKKGWAAAAKGAGILDVAVLAVAAATVKAGMVKAMDAS
jgi:hypothetical protein